MKNLLVVLSASVLGSLSMYALFNACGLIGLFQQNVMVNVDTFVWLLGAVSLVTAGTTLGLRALVARTDREATRSLEQRIAELETRAQQRVSA